MAAPATVDRRVGLQNHKGLDLLHHLADSWPGRAQQIELLLAAIGDGRTAAPPIVVYGGPSTGKTTITRLRPAVGLLEVLLRRKLLRSCRELLCKDALHRTGYGREGLCPALQGCLCEVWLALCLHQLL